MPKIQFNILYYLYRMFLSFSTYRRFLVLALTVLMAVPCFAKSELKQWLHIESSQQAKPVQQRVACYTICQLQKQNKEEKVEKQLLSSPISDSKPAYFSYVKTIFLADFYNSKKQKIPSYLLFGQFLL